jgi:SET domain-containing protein
MLYNHSAEPNLEYAQDDPSAIEFYAARAVEPGEELTIDYAGDWWASRGREPS